MLGNIVLLILLIISFYWYYQCDETKNEKRGRMVVLLTLTLALVYRIS